MKDSPGEILYANKQIVGIAFRYDQPAAGRTNTVSTIGWLPQLAQCFILIEKLHRHFFLRS
jgi:hypothetical protein